MTYPVKIPLRWRLVEELGNSECGLWEDYGQPDQEDPDNPFTYLICQRHKSQLEIRNAKEASEVYWAVSSGTFQLRHVQAARNIADRLYHLVPKKTTDHYYPTGH